MACIEICNIGYNQGDVRPYYSFSECLDGPMNSETQVFDGDPRTSLY